MVNQTGGCLCGQIRYEVTAQPARVSFCHCRICQRQSGAAYAVEPIFARSDFKITQGTPKTYDHLSEGSGKVIHSHFCTNCGSGLFYTFERYPENMGIHAGGFDDPNWFEWDASNAKHIFLDSAQHGTVIPAGIPVFDQHAVNRDDSLNTPTILDAPKVINRR